MTQMSAGQVTDIPASGQRHRRSRHGEMLTCRDADIHPASSPPRLPNRLRSCPVGVATAAGIA
jgi:hypothetical protein